MSENTGRSYRRINSRKAASRPFWASATTSASGRFCRSRAGGIGLVARAQVLGAPSVDQSYANPYPATSRFGLPRHPGTGKFRRMSVSEVETDEAREAAAGGATKREYVRRTFGQIAPSYDRLNHLLSLNVDRRWRRRAIAALDWPRSPQGTYV